MRAIYKTFKEFYGPNITGKLGDELIHFKGKAHLLAATIKRTIKSNGITERITGLHWDFGRKLEQLGVYSLSDVKHLAGGMYEATLNYGGVVKKGKTFFPSHWDARMLASKISEACHNVINVKPLRKGGMYILGEVSDGFRIVIKLDLNGKILTIYPTMLKEII